MEHLKFKSRFALLLAVLIAPFAGVSAAGLIDVSGYGSASAQATSTAVHANLDLGASASSSAGAHSASSTGSENSQGALHANVNALENANAHSNIEIYNRTTASSTGTMSPEMTAGNVQTESDLGAFAATSLRADANLDSLAFAPDRVEIAYHEPARFLGFIPSSVSVSVVAHDDGSVAVTYPWYSFLMITDRTGLETSIKNEVSAFMIENHISGNLSTTMRAELAARIMAVLEARLNGSATASTTQTSY